MLPTSLICLAVMAQVWLTSDGILRKSFRNMFGKTKRTFRFFAGECEAQGLEISMSGWGTK